MKNKAKIYAKALAEVVLASEKDRGRASINSIVENFLALLNKAGQRKKAKEIVAMAEGFLLKKHGKKKIVFETARKMTAGQKKITESFIEEGDAVLEKVNPDLIAGIKITLDGEKQLDVSLFNKLSNLF